MDFLHLTDEPMSQAGAIQSMEKKMKVNKGL
jgi:hypothetical protein